MCANIISIKDNMNDFIITIGKNAIDNMNILDKADKNDLWFHVENSSSSHVIIHSCNNINIPKNLIYRAAILCKKHSKLSKMKNISVIYTEVMNVTKMEKIGSVTTIKTKRIIV